MSCHTRLEVAVPSPLSSSQIVHIVTQVHPRVHRRDDVFSLFSGCAEGCSGSLISRARSPLTGCPNCLIRGSDTPRLPHEAPSAARSLSLDISLRSFNLSLRAPCRRLKRHLSHTVTHRLRYHRRRHSESVRSTRSTPKCHHPSLKLPLPQHRPKSARRERPEDRCAGSKEVRADKAAI